MAFREKNMNEIFGTVLVLSALLSTASAVDCFGKSFHCVNSTHFMICVDLGGGVSQSIDDFLIPCPPPTVCQGNNHFECEFPAVTTPSTTLSNVISETTEPWEEIVVTTNSPPKNTSTTKEYSEKYMNTVSITTISEDNLTTDTTVDVTTETSPLNIMNNNSNVDPTSPMYEATSGFDGITQTIPDKIVTSTAEITTDMPQIIAVYEKRNVTNEITIDNVTLNSYVTEPKITLNNNDTVASTNSAGDVINIAVASQVENFTSKNISDEVVMPNTLLIDSSRTERPLKTITDESLVTDVNIVMMTDTQSLVSTDGLQNLANLNIQTTTVEPAIIQNTLGIEQIQKPVFEENLTTDSVHNFSTEQSTVLTPDVVESIPTQLPIKTYQSTVSTITSINDKDEVTEEITIDSQIITTKYEDKFSTADHDINATEAPLAIATDGKQDTQNINVSDQAPTMLTENTIVQSTPDTNSLSSNIDVTTEQTIAYTTETQKLLVTEQSKINKHSSATEKIPKPTVTEPLNSSQKRLTTDQVAISENPSNLATETQMQQNKNIATIGSDAATEASALPTEAQKPIYKSVEQSKDSSKSLATDSEIITENPGEFATEKSKQEETGQLTTNKNIAATDNEVITEASVLSTEVAKPIRNEGEQQKNSTKILPSETISVFTTVTQKTIYIEKPTTTNSITDTQEPTKQIIELEKPFFMGINKITANNNSLVIDNDVTAEKASDFTKKGLKPFYTSTEQPITSKQNLATDTDTIAENPRNFTMETEKPIYMRTQQSTTNESSLATDIEESAEKSSVFTTKPIPMSTVQPTTIKNNLATDSEVTSETAIVSAAGTSKSTIQIKKEIAFGLSDNNIAAEQQKQESLLTDITIKSTTEKITIPLDAITTDAITQSAGVTEQPITTALGDNILIDTTTSNIESNVTKIVQSMNTSTTTEPTTLKIAEDKIKEEITAFSSSAKASISDIVNELQVDNVQTVNNNINEQPNQNLFEVTTGTVDSLIPTTVKGAHITKDDGLSSAESTLNLSNGQQKDMLSTHIDKSNLTNGVTTDASPNVANEINTLIIDSGSSINTYTKLDTTSGLGINELNYSNPKTEKSTTQDILSVVENVENNQQMTESNFKVTTAFTTKDTTTYNNIDGSDTGISNATLNEHIIKTDTVNSATERVNYIPAENIGEHVAQKLPSTETVELRSTSTLNQVDSRSHSDSYNKTKKTNSGQLSSAEVTSETTATENFTPSLYPNDESSQKDKHFTLNNQVTLENTEILIDNFADGTSSFTTASNTILNEKDNDLNIVLPENGNIYNTWTSLNTQDNSYVTFATEKVASSSNNVANNQVPKLTAITENVTQEILQLSTQMNDFTTTGIIEHTETTFIEKSTTIDGIDFELHIKNKNEIVQRVETTTQPFDGGEPMPTGSSNKNGNVNKLLITQDNSYVSFTTEKEESSPYSVANNQVPKLTAITENVTQETLQLSTQTNDFTKTGSIENTETTFIEKSTTIEGIDFELHIKDKNETVQRVETTTQPFDNGEPTQTNDFKSSSVTNANNDVDDFTTITRVIENKETTLTEKTTAIDGIDFELHITNKHEKERNEKVETTTQPFDNGDPMHSNPLFNILLDKINQAVIPATDITKSFSTKNEGNVNSMDILSTGTYSITDESSKQLYQVENTNDVTTQASELQKTWQTASMKKTEKPSNIQTKTISLKENSAPEQLFSNSGNVVTSFAIPTADSTTKISLIEGVQNVYKTIANYFNTPSETSTSGTFNKKGNGDITPLHSSYDIQDNTQISSSTYNTDSLTGKNDNYDSLITKLGPINLLLPVTSSGDYSTIEMSTESSKNNNGDNTISKKPAILKALPVPNHEIKNNTVNINVPIAKAKQANKTSETKILKELYNSATFNPTKYVTSTINNYQYVSETSDSSTASTVDIPLKVSQQTVNAFKTDAKSLPGQNNEQNVAIKSIYQNNSSYYPEKASSGSKSTLVTQSTNSKSSNNLTRAVNEQSYSKSHADSTITTSQVTEKVGLATNTTETVNTETYGNTLQNNSSIGPRIIHQAKNSTITVIASKNVSKDITKNDTLLLQKSTNTTKSNTQGDLKSQQKTTTNPIEHDVEQVKPRTSKQDRIHSVTIISQVPTTKITPRPVATTTTNENVGKTSPKTAPVSYIRRYSDKDDCRKFYICIGNSQPIVGNCPANTVFSDIFKMCTKNLSHCIRENEFKCPSTGRFSDTTKDNVYYICVSHKNHLFRFKFQCQKGFTLNKTTIQCIENREIESNESVSIPLSENSSDTSSSRKISSSSMSTSSDRRLSSNGSSSENNNSSSVSSTSKNKEKKESKEKHEGKEGDEEDEVFECDKEGKFPVPNDCRRYYLCKKNRKSEYRRKIKKCESGDVFHKGKKKCVDADSYECSKNSLSSDSQNNSDRQTSKRRQRKEKKEEPESSDSENNSDRHLSKIRQSKEKTEEPESEEDDENEVFECEREGKFPVPGDCKRYYLCKKNKKSEYRRKIKKCDSDEVFHKSKKMCVDADSYEC